ncbi:MGMT family protein [Candidatus Woesearchaeota archaeon]|nr:MGMT family protein [Candidatus Woesearchaeota archaeon]
MPTKFQDRVYELCSKVPKGRVVTYKAIAEAMRTKAYRAVGQALNKNPYAPKVPCHRVVNSQGHLHGFAHGLKAKARMLRKEGIKIKNNRIEDKKRIITKIR